MTCILKSCTHAKTGCCASLSAAGMGDCGVAYALDLASRNDGYLVQALDNPTLDALRRAGLVYTRPSGADGYVIARAIQAPLKRIYGHGSRFARPVEAEVVAAP
jgi:hypothetical protein